MKNKRALYPLAALIFLGVGLTLFILVADEQSILSSGLSAPARFRLQDLTRQGPGNNKHVQLEDFSVGKQYIYATKLVQFKEVYLPLFPLGEPEAAANLHLLLWIRNDRNSNERLIEDAQDLDRFVGELNRSPRSVSGVLRNPIARVRSLTVEAYPGANAQSLQVLWARDFPTQRLITLLSGLLALCLAAAAVCAVAYTRHRKSVSPRAN